MIKTEEFKVFVLLCIRRQFMKVLKAENLNSFIGGICNGNFLFRWYYIVCTMVINETNS